MRGTDADRSWQAGHGEPWTSKRDEQGRSNARHSWLVIALHIKSKEPGDMCSHIPVKEWSQTRKVMLQKWRHKNGSTVFILTSPKTEIVTYAWKPKLRGFLAEDVMRDLSVSRKVWWLDNSRAQNPQRRTWISEQSPIRCRGTRWSPSVESVSNQNFTGDGEEFTKVPTAVAAAKSNSYEQFVRFWQVLWRIIKESSNKYTSSIRDKRNFRTSYSTSKGRNISCISAIPTGWWMVVRFYEMLLQSAKWRRPPGRREISKWTKIWGILLGHALFARRIWEEDFLTAEIEELEKLDASETYPRRLNAKEVLTTPKDGELIFLVADGSAKSVWSPICWINGRKDNLKKFCRA